MYVHCQHPEDYPQSFAEIHSFQHDLGVWHQPDHVTRWWVWLHERCPLHLQDSTGRNNTINWVAWLHVNTHTDTHTHTHTHTHPPTRRTIHNTRSPWVRLSQGSHDLLECLFPQCPHCRPSIPLSPPETYRHLVHKDNQ